MRTILAIETSSDIASVALLHDGVMLTRRSVGVQTHSQTVLPMVQALLAEAGLTVTQCDAIAFGAGPGSFTGVRTACGVAQGLAFGADLPVAPVVTLDAMALACFNAHPDVPSVVAMLDARMGEVYWAQYRQAAAGDQRIIVAPSLAAPGSIQPAPPFALCGNAAAAYPDALTEVRRASLFEIDTLPDAQEVALLGLRLAAEGALVSPEHAQPLYLRNKVAQTVAERAAKVGA